MKRNPSKKKSEKHWLGYNSQMLSREIHRTYMSCNDMWDVRLSGLSLKHEDEREEKYKIKHLDTQTMKRR